MPLLRYFLYVGGALLGLLFLADAELPRPQLRSEPAPHLEIRIASSAVGPAAVSFSGHAVNHGVAPSAMQVIDLSARAADAKTQACAQAPEGSPEAKPQPAAKPAPQRPRKRYARRPAPPAPEPADIWALPRFNVVSGVRF